MARKDAVLHYVAVAAKLNICICRWEYTLASLGLMVLWRVTCVCRLLLTLYHPRVFCVTRFDTYVQLGDLM